MIGNMAADEALTPEERKALTHAFYRGFSRRMDGQTEWLRQEMERQGISMEDWTGRMRRKGATWKNKANGRRICPGR